MLNFKDWLEGFRVDYSKLPDFLQAPNDDDFETFLKKPSSVSIGGFDSSNILGARKKEVIDQLHQIEELMVFDIEKHPEDFIDVDFSNNLSTLSIKDSQRLNSFRSKILYGMKFEMKGEKVAIYFKEKLKKLTEDYERLTNTRRSVDIRLNADIQKIILRIYEDLKSKGAYLQQIEKHMPSMIAHELDKIAVKYVVVRDASKNISTLMIGGGKSKVKLDWQKIKQVIDQSNAASSPKITMLRKEIQALKEVIDRFQNNVEYKSKWHNIIQQVFLKKTKHPASAADQKLQEYFVDLSVENYVNFIKDGYYDMILYPESSSSLNKMIATKLGKHYGCEAIMGFKKKEMITIDIHNFIKKNSHLSGEKLTGALNRLRDQIFSSDGEIKKISINQAFVRNWDVNSEVLKKINKKIILVVDDNYRSGGTLQAINKVLWNIGSPRYVGYYVPLYANFSV
jgi:hypothetical protein